MSDLRSELPHETASGGIVRDAKIEELLLVGLDHYFAGQYEQAIHVWTRVLFLDRGHARARAYIERARNAIAERQRESEELLQAGIAAFERGDADTARQLLETCVERGGPSDVALAVLTRINRREPVGTDHAGEARIAPSRTPAAGVSAARAAAPWRMASLVAAATLVAGIGAIAIARGWLQWLTVPPRSAGAAVLTPRPEALRVPRAAEGALARARALYDRGHLHDALAALDEIDRADPLKPDADRLKADIQRALIETATLAPTRSLK